MNKKIVIGAVVILIILIAGFMIFNNSSNGNTNNLNQGNLESAPVSAFTNLDTNDQVLNEIDFSLNELG